MSEISNDDARWKPADDRFSIAEVLSHLSHSEGHCYRSRLDRFLFTVAEALGVEL